MIEMPELAGWETPSVGKALWSLLAKGGTEIRARQSQSDRGNQHCHSFCAVVPFANRDRGTRHYCQRDHHGEHYHTFTFVVPLATMMCSVVPFDKRDRETKAMIMVPTVVPLLRPMVMMMDGMIDVLINDVGR